MSTVVKRKVAPRPAKPRTTARRRLAHAAVLRASVRHIVLPGQVIAVTPSRRRETIAGFLRRTQWSRHSKRYGWQFTLPTICLVNGAPVLQKHWRTTRIRAGDSVEFWSRPLGGSRGTKQVLGIVALVAVAALSLYAGPAGASFLGGLLPGGTILTPAGFSLLSTGISAAIGCGGGLQIDALRGTA